MLSLGVPSDPDLGWHLQNGNYILENLRLPAGDIYSWTMPGYPWVSHEWGMDTLMAWLNNQWGLWALVLFFALVIASAFYIVSGAVSASRIIRVLVAIIGLMISWVIIGVRPQMITLLGIAILLYLLFNWKKNPQKKWLIWLPLLFFVWANLHGGFPFGFIMIVTFGAGELGRHILSAGKEERGLLTNQDLSALAKWSILAFVVTFINPNGWRVYLELYQTFVDRDVLNRIMEWLPITLTSAGSYNMALMVGLLLALLVINKGRFDTTKLVMVIAVFLFSLSSWRHLPIFALTAMILLAEQLEILFRKGLARTLGTFLGLVSLATVLFLAGSWQIFRIGEVITKPDLYGEVYNYPYGAIQYLKENPPPTQMRFFNEYGWGGYLIWQYPEQKIFIDGRMAVWRHPKFNIFNDLSAITGVDRRTVSEALERWQIDLILVASSRPVNELLKEMPDRWLLKYKDRIATVWEKI